MTPDAALDLIMRWFPVIIIGLWFLNYIISYAKSIFRNTDD